jgi:broad specificity phosphatase PhoE
MSTQPPTKAGSATEPAFAAPPLPDSAAVWLVRHGETEWSRSGQHTGRTDVALTPLGEQQAAALRPVFASLRPALVLASPRQRALRTAELADLTVDAVDPDLAEWDYGDYEGLTTAQIHERHDPDWTIFTGVTPGGETPAQVAVRVDRVLTRVLGYVAQGPVVLVAHGHIGRVIGARWIGLEVRDGRRFALGTATTCRLGAEHGIPVINQWNVPNPLTNSTSEQETK